MALFRQYIAPLLVVIIFVISLVVVSARIFLPADMAAPAPTDQVSQSAAIGVADLPPALTHLIKGLPDDPALVEQF
ncbi:hypothetical protein BST81_23170 [Leptolyngbya sp. 'hensonii']|uniref:hypothetical protein n=1 Tax=Leptolyngbya sp. 'hensonii' TaxID=1922337 RepID=UPI000950334C|nr:hypothetical protein [Leptolyngbya sp. 'hensonii']OLP15966.1 hypothetical protein BST81_23170 [Leptolyngbya sp. 'hensonii']